MGFGFIVAMPQGQAERACRAVGPDQIRPAQLDGRQVQGDG
jgi:hypothetical protein